MASKASLRYLEQKREIGMATGLQSLNMEKRNPYFMSTPCSNLPLIARIRENGQKRCASKYNRSQTVPPPSLTAS